MAGNPTFRPLIAALTVVAGCGGDGANDSGDVAPGEPAELLGITDAHNRIRAEVGVDALVWNDDLEDLAAAFIADCVFDHSTLAERSDVAGFAYVGENLYWASGFQPTGAEVSDAWASEEADYGYSTNSCASVCGHYTQQVWATTTDLGCALKACPDSTWLVACEYGPGGNYEGQRPY